MIICFGSPIRVNPQGVVGGWLAALWPGHRGGEGGSVCTLWGQQNWLVFTISAGTFWQIQSDISGFVSRMAFCDAGPVNRVSPADFWVNFRRSALDIWANLREGSRWSFRLSTGVARTQATVAAQKAGGLPSRTAFPSSPGTVLTVGGWLGVVCQKHRAGEGW